MNGIRRSWIAALCTLLIQGCGESPPAYTSNEDDARVYADVVGVSRDELNLSGPMYLHPYLAVARDEKGAPLVDLSSFEYEPSAALDLLSERDSTVVLCQANAQGMCAEDYVVMSQIARLSERDAVVVVRSIRGRAVVGALIVKLRYGHGSWKITGSELIT